MSLSALLDRLKRLSRRLGVRVLAMALVALLATLFAPLLNGFIPEGLKERFDRQAVEPVLNILASTMLAVTTFSLGVMVQAFQSASGQATPRAYRILMRDGTTQTVLATFVGAFLFSLTAFVLFRAGFYGDAAAVVVFGLTALVILLIIIAILRWIGHLSELGNMDHTLRLCEDAAAMALGTHARQPYLGGRKAHGPEPQGWIALPAPRSGYVVSVAMAAIDDACAESDTEARLAVRPGDYVLEGAPLLWIARPVDSDVLDTAIALGPEREPQQDPRFGLLVLAEIGARALSPGVNDPGTAIDVIHRQTALLWHHALEAEQPDAPEFERVSCPGIEAEALVADAVAVLIRDGRARVEVMERALKMLDRLATAPEPGIAEAAAGMKSYAEAQARDGIALEADLKALGLTAEITRDPDAS
ncbi:DUF2254 domain-containing protein [Litorisediminicola beolgyonensis]|uniref:DUF2254 domain-containing protein n=1 Tax=Litorisediminicola beolgyonensis TaxID=1173614 RepID=A0ABW3ZES7_9RHOB